MAVTLPSSGKLWRANPEATSTSIELLRAVLRDLSEEHDAELLPERTSHVLASFADPVTALSFFAALCRSLLATPWPADLLGCDAAAEVRDDAGLLLRGPRLATGLAMGAAEPSISALGGESVASGPAIELAMRLADRCPPNVCRLAAEAHARLGPAGIAASGCALEPALSARFGLSVVPREFRGRVAVSTGEPRTNLPVAALAEEPLFGRSALLSQLEARLDQRSTLALIGAPGIGKTAVARRVAARWSRDSEAWYIDASSVASISELSTRIAAAMSAPLPASDDAVAALLNILAGRDRILLVIDEADGAASHVSAFGAQLGARAPTARLLVVGRQQTSFDTLRVPPLDTDSSEALARREAGRARAAVGAEAPGPDAITTVVEATGGVPLLIRLAANRARTLDDESLGESLGDLVESSPLATSVASCSERERALLLTAAVFDGGFASKDLMRLSGADAAELSELVASALIEPVIGVAGRYTLLRPIAELVLETSQPAEVAARRLEHARHFSAFGEALAGALDGPDEVTASNRIVREADNLRRAFRTLRAEAPDDAIRALLPVERILDRRGPLPLQGELAEAVADSAARSSDPALRVSASIIEGRTLRWQGELAQAAEVFEGAYAEACEEGLSESANTAALGLAALAQQRGSYGEALEWARRAVDAVEGRGTASEAHARAWCGFVQQWLGESKSAYDELLGAVDLARRCGNPTALKAALGFLGPVAVEASEPNAARRALDEALALSRELGNRRGEVGILFDLANVEFGLGEDDRASQRLVEAIEWSRRFGASHYIGVLRFARGALHFAGGELAAARDDLEASLEALGQGLPTITSRAHAYLGAIAALGEEPATSERHFRLADTLLDRARMPGEAAQVDVLAGFGALVAGDIDDAKQVALGGVSSSDAATSRSAKRLLEMVEAVSGVADLVVGGDTRWFMLRDGPRVDISRRGAIRRILDALVERHGGEALDLHEVIEAGWPGEIITPEAAARRVYSTINRMRELGLGGLLVTLDEGYLLEPGARVVRHDEG